jgi:hypothetical protein
MFGITFVVLPLLLTILATIETLELSTCFDEVNAIRHLIEQCQTFDMFDKKVKSEIESCIRSLISLLKVQKMYILIDMLLVYLPVVIPIDMGRLVDCLTTKRYDMFDVKTNSNDYELTVIESYVFVVMYTSLLDSFKLLKKMFICCNVDYLDSLSTFDITQIAINCVYDPCEEYITLTKQMWAHICNASTALSSGQNRIAANAFWNALVYYILKSTVLSYGGHGFSTLGVDDLSNNAKRTTRLVNTMWNMLRYIIIALKEFSECNLKNCPINQDPLSDNTLKNMQWVKEAGVGVLTLLADTCSGELQSEYKPIRHGRCSVGKLYGLYDRIIIDSRRRGIPGINPNERVPNRSKK